MNRNNKTIDWNELSYDLIENCETYHDNYYDSKKFTGPSLHFHRRALSAFDNEKSEMIYALLVAWGMHRMGGGAQMNEFDVFQTSLEEHLPAIQNLSLLKLDSISESDFDLLEEIFENLKAMRTSVKIVAHSKILAHSSSAYCSN